MEIIHEMHISLCLLTFLNLTRMQREEEQKEKVTSALLTHSSSLERDAGNVRNARKILDLLCEKGTRDVRTPARYRSSNRRLVRVRRLLVDQVAVYVVFNNEARRVEPVT